MSKKKKKSTLVYSPEAVEATKKSLKAFNWRRLLIIVGSTLGAFTLLEGVMAIEAQSGLGFSVIMPIYYIFVTLLVLAVIFLNHGFSKGEFTPDMLDESIDPEQADEICARLNRQRVLAKKLMYVLIPFALALLLDFVYLFYGDILAGIFSLLVPT